MFLQQIPEIVIVIVIETGEGIGNLREVTGDQNEVLVVQGIGRKPQVEEETML